MTPTDGQIQTRVVPRDRDRTEPVDPGSGVLSVCHIVSGDLWAGAEVQVAGLLRGLSSRPDMRVSAIVLNEGRLARELRESCVDVCVIPEDTYRFDEILFMAEPFVATHRPDVLHSHRYKENLLALFLARWCRVPAQVRTHHGWPERVAGFGALHRGTLECLDRFCGRRFIDAVIGVSAEMMPELKRVYSKRAVLVRNAIDTHRVGSALSRDQARLKLNLPIDAPVIGIVGRLEAVKRVDLFLESARRLLRSYPSAHFVVAGTGRMEQQLRLQASSLSLDGLVHFLGHRDDVHDVLRALDVLVMCSDHEGLPMVMLEALWLGVPVVGRAVGGINEVLGSQECGLTVNSSQPADFAEAVERLLRDARLRDRLRCNGMQHVQDEFSLDRAVNEMVHEYRRVSAEKSGIY